MFSSIRISFKLPFNMVHIMDISFLVFLILSMTSCGSSSTFNVMNFGAVGDGVRDDSQAFLKAWNAACNEASSNSALLIPRTKFLLRPLSFSGPCKPSLIIIQVSGDISAPKSVKAWGGRIPDTWLDFRYIDGLFIKGRGTLDGQGSVWWPHRTIDSDEDNGEPRPLAMAFSFCNNLQIYGLNVINSPSKHVKLFKCNGASISNLNIKAPQESPNTDGLVIAESTHIQVHDCNIGTGDDCIAILTGSSSLNITGITCGPGHGISIGSLGMNGAYDTVEEIHVRDSTFTGTQNGVRIKTWQGGAGYARKISFWGITLNAVQNPIIIDQYYCPSRSGCPIRQSAVKVSDVSYNRIQGTATTKEAINLNCSRSTPCTNILLNQINITSATQEFETSSKCFNAHVRVGSTIPDMRCRTK